MRRLLTAATTLVVAVAALALMTRPAQATVMIPLDFRQVVSAATVIVQGHITDVRVVAPSTSRVETVATIAVDATFKGETDPFVSIRVPGGAVGNLNVVVVDSPKFSTGEVVVLFLKKGSDNVLRPVGRSLGVDPVAVDPQTGQTAIAPPVALGFTTAAGPVVHGDPRRKMMTVSEFGSLVRLVIASQAHVSPRGGRS
jgi:hypothetical protein